MRREQVINESGELVGNQLLTGLGGAIGGDYSIASGQFVFTEYAGKLSRLNLVRPLVATVSQGTGLLKGTYSFDFDTGAMVSGAGADVFWEQFTSVKRGMVPQNGAKVVNLGPVSFSGLNSSVLQGLAYASTPINGNADATNQLTVGDVFAVQTNGGNFAKVKILAYGYDLQIQWKTYKVGAKYEVLGTGYNQPEDVVLSQDGLKAWVTERVGTLVRVNLAMANRASATVLASGLTAPQQISVDESSGLAFVVEYANPGRLLRIPLTGGAPVAVAANLENAVGLLVDGDNAYISEQAAGGGRLVRLHMPSGQRQILATGLVAPFFLDWLDDTHTKILVPERDPANRITLLDLTTAPPSTMAVANPVPNRPSSATPISPTKFLVASDSEIDSFDLSVFDLSGPLFLGIGHVPVTSIDDGSGLATTAPGYFFQVQDSPFGGVLSINVNHDNAFTIGAKYYKVFVDGVEQRGDFTDYLWVAADHAFMPTPVIADASGYYKIRTPSELWYNHFLGLRLDTTGFGNGMHQISVAIYDSSHVVMASGSIQSRHVRIDNTWPQASIDAIMHDGVAVNKCGIVRTGTDAFQFQVTAHDPDGNLLSWSLYVLWGDNQSVGIASEAYPPTPPSVFWSGPVGALVPAAPWASTKGVNPNLPIGPSNPEDPYSHWCAHTFVLSVWDRAIDGYSRIHNATYTKSITIMLPPIPPGP